MGIEELNFSSAVLQGSAFSALADLVADLASQKDASNTVGLTYIELQNLVKSFGFETMAKLARNGKLDTGVSGELFWTLPLSEVQKLSVPVVIGSNIVTAVGADKDKNLPSGDQHFIKLLAKGYVDISANKTGSGQVVDDQNNALGAGFEFPAGKELDAIDWFDLSAVVKAKNIRFDERSEVTDVSAIFSLLHRAEKYDASVNEVECSRSGDRLNDTNQAKVQGAGNYSSASVTDKAFNERDRDYLNFLNLFEPTPSWRDLSDCGIVTIAPYLEAGLYKNVLGYGLNKEYLTTASSMRTKIRNNVRGTNNNAGANLRNEFQILKDYGFPKQKAAEAYKAELAYGVSGTSGVEFSSEQTSYDTTNYLCSPEDIQAQFASVYGSSGSLADHVTDMEAISVFNDTTGGIKLADLKAATNVKSWVEYINAVKDFIASDQDYHWSETGIAFPINKVGSEREEWEDYQERITIDPRLAHLPNLVLTEEQDERLRILLETISNADASNNVTQLDKDLSFSSWTQNDMTLGLANDLSNAPVYIKNGKFYNANNKNEINTKSIWAAAVKHGWSDATEVYGNLKGSGLFMMDSVYNVRSRIRKLEGGGTGGLTQALRDGWKDSTSVRSRLRKDKTTINLSGSKNVYEYFTPGHFQDAFFDMNNLQHTANVALRYFDVETQTSIADDVSKNVSSIDNIISYSLPLRTMDTAANVEDTANKYASTTQHARIGWVYNELVRKSFNTTKAAIAEITSWRPVPPQLYVDVSDVTGYTERDELVKQAQTRGDFIYNLAEADYDNRNLPGAMIHVMANYFAKASVENSSTAGHNKNKEADLITLLDLHPVETLRAFKMMNQNIDISSATLFSLENNSGSSYNIDSTNDNDKLVMSILQALVHYGKPTSHFNAIGAIAKTAIDAYEKEVEQWATDMGNNMGVFGDDADVFSMVQHLGYWVPYLSQYSPAEIAEEAANDDDIQNISDGARALMLGLLLAATRGTLTSSRASDAPARIAGLNAFHDAGIPKMLVDIAYTSRGINVFANLTGSNYDA